MILGTWCSLLLAWCYCTNWSILWNLIRWVIQLCVHFWRLDCVTVDTIIVQHNRVKFWWIGGNSSNFFPFKIYMTKSIGKWRHINLVNISLVNIWRWVNSSKFYPVKLLRCIRTDGNVLWNIRMYVQKLAIFFVIKLST